MGEQIVILHNIRSAQNVGAIFRTADGAGVSKIFLTGYTPAPIDRFGRPDPKIEKTSLGACRFVEWEQCVDVLSVIAELKRTGVSVVAVEQDQRAVSLFEYKETGTTAFVFGNEVTGIDKEILDAAHVIVEISMFGKKESLNVSVSAGVVLYAGLFRKQK